MGLDIGDGIRIDIGHSQRFGDDLGLPLNTGGAKADFLRAIVIDRRAFDHRQNVVAVGQGFAQAFEDNDTDAAAKNRALGAGVKGPTMTVGREDRALLVKITFSLLGVDGDATGQRQITFMVQQALGGQMHSYQARRTGRLYVDTGAFEIQFVGGLRHQIIFIIAKERLQVIDGSVQRCQCMAVLEKVAALAGTGKDAGGAGKAGKIHRRRLQRFPGAFQKEALLRVGQLGLAGRHRKKVGVKLIDICQHQAGAHIGGLRPLCGRYPGGS